MTHSFWNERFWLPNNITWADLRDTPLAKYPQIEDLLIVIPIALVLFLSRLLFERLLAQPVGVCIGISPRGPRKPVHNAILERVFHTITQKPDEKRLKGLEKQLDWSPYQIRQWFARRRAQIRPTKMAKFKESLWKLVYYTGILGYGLFVLSEEDFFYELSKCWTNYPFQPVSTNLRNYYVTELSFYVSLVLCEIVSVKRKGYRQMLTHHLITILLMIFSYVDNFIRIGCVILITHDIADVWLETVKLLNYTKCSRLSNFVFAIFALHFIATRLVYFPFWIIYSTLVQTLPSFGFFPAYVVFNALLVGLLLLHIYWAALILHVGYTLLTTPASEQSSCPQIYSDSALSEDEQEYSFHSTPTYLFRISSTLHNGSASGGNSQIFQNGNTSGGNGLIGKNGSLAKSATLVANGNSCFMSGKH